ncbi:MAG: DUF1285 domain-containing protein [Polyangiales bacterium]|nr:DUF1285 domain-containing protein [Myxococcales bacterium]
MDPKAMLEGRTRETRIRRDAAGRWWNGEEPISHPNLVRAFDAWVDRAEDGRFCLKNDINWAYVAIEGAPFFVRGVRVTDGGGAELLLSDGKHEPLDPDSLRQDASGVLHCSVHGGAFAARFDRGAMHDLAPILEADGEGVFLRIGGRAIRPPVVADPVSWAPPG